MCNNLPMTFLIGVFESTESDFEGLKMKNSVMRKPTLLHDVIMNNA